ncbi:hypothetical protein ACWDPV_15955 [Gordonia sp. NPDC003504]
MIEFSASDLQEVGNATTTVEGLAAEVDTLRREVTLLRAHLRRVDKDLKATGPLVEVVRGLTIWDYTPYRVNPGSDWVAIDRTQAEELLATLAAIDHWTPWRTRLEPRPQP